MCITVEAGYIGATQFPENPEGVQICIAVGETYGNKRHIFYNTKGVEC